MERLYVYYALSESVVGWTRGAEAKALTRYAHALPDHAKVVEIGAFLGSGTVLLAGARKLRRSGMVHSVDPFDASGDDFSRPHYDEILQGNQRPQLEQFKSNIARAGLSRWAQAHVGKAEEVAAHWHEQIDMLYMDGDQSPAGAGSAYEAWQKWLKPNAIVALHNSDTREYAPTHDGHFQLRRRLERAPNFEWLEQAGTTNFFRKLR